MFLTNSPMSSQPLMSLPCTLYLLFLFLLLYSATATVKPPYTPSDLILLSCGETGSASSLDDRTWEGDALSKFLLEHPQSVSSASEPDPSVPPVPFSTARVFRSNITYVFPVNPGPKFVRLYFYPANYSDVDISKSFFSVTANKFTVLYNFSAYLGVSALTPSVHTLVKEFVVPVFDDEKLALIFSPSPASFGFINGIEIVSMPNTLYYPGGADDELTYVGFQGLPLDNFTALQTVYRINVGGNYIGQVDDTGMFREWLQDREFIFGPSGLESSSVQNNTVIYTEKTPPYVAPEDVYRSMRSMGMNPQTNSKYNLTWDFPVDGGFTYLVRLHFCDTRMEVTRPLQNTFSVFITNETAEIDADVIHWSGGNNIAVYRDYLAFVLEGSSSLWLALHPNTKTTSDYRDAILSGLELFKLNNSDGSLAGANPEPVTQIGSPMTPQQKRAVRRFKLKGVSLILTILGAVTGIFAVCFIVSFFVYRRCKKARDSDYKDDAKSSWIHPSLMTKTHRSRSTNTTASVLPSTLCRQFSIFEMQVATGNFDDQNIIGSGGFGNVYKGYINDGGTPVAVKRLNAASQQGAREFKMEIDLLSKLRHHHLVSLIGYCDDPGEMILVYEYMHHGTLRDHLYKNKNPPLTFKQRLQICIGAAKGLHYLHTGSKNIIIHRDVKSTNILLDENLVAKVSDFGLSRIGPTSLSQTHVSTVVRGSIGYVDPEYFRRQKLTEKSDVYSFGVVLLEVLSNRPPIIPGLPKERVSLADWGRLCLQKGEIDQIIDPNLKGKIAHRCLNKFAEIAQSCVSVRGVERPTIGDVIWGLEFALQFQETAENGVEVCLRQGRALLQPPTISDDDANQDYMFSSSITANRSKSKSTVSSSSGDNGRNFSQSY